MKALLFILAVYFLVVSCITDNLTYIGEIPHEKRPVVFAEFAMESNIRIYTSFTEPFDYYLEENFVLVDTIIVKNQSNESFSFIKKDGFYESTQAISEAGVYSIEIHFISGEIVKGSTQVFTPPSLKINSVTYDFTKGFSRIDFSLSNPEVLTESMFFRLLVAEKEWNGDTIFYPHYNGIHSNNSELFSNTEEMDLEDGIEFTSSGYVLFLNTEFKPTKNKDLSIYIQDVDETQIDRYYLQATQISTIYRQFMSLTNSNIDISFISEPGILPTNLDGGVGLAFMKTHKMIKVL